MSLYKCIADLRELPEDARLASYEYLDRASFTGLYDTKIRDVYECFVEETEMPLISRHVPANVLHRVP